MGTGSERQHVKTLRKFSFAQCLSPFIDGPSKCPLERGTGTVRELSPSISSDTRHGASPPFQLPFSVQLSRSR